MSMRLGIGIGLSYGGVAGAVSFAPATPDIFVDSVNGDDGNDGLTAETAFQTLGAVTWDDDVYAALVSGSTWTEAIDEATTDGLTLEQYGAGDLPVIDGSDVVTAWTAEGTANVWQATVAHDAVATNRGTVYEDGTLLVRVANAATCSSTPGSFVDIKGSDGTPWTVKIHASDSGDPTSNGKAYRVSTRNIGITVDAGATLEGIRAQRVISNNGAIEAHLNATIRKCLSVNGTKHNILIGSGLVEDVIAARTDATTSYEVSQTYFVGFNNDAAGLSLTFRRAGCFPELGGTRRGVGLVMHDTLGNPYTSFNGEQLWSVDCPTGFSIAALTVTVNGLYAHNCHVILGGLNFDSATYAYVQSDQDGINHTAAILDLKGASSATAARAMVIENSVFYSVAASAELIRLGDELDGLDLTFRNCVIYMGGFRPIFAAVGPAWSSGSLTIENCIICYPGNTSAAILVPTGITYTGDNNVFLDSSATGTNLNLSFEGTTHDAIADWRTATGQDANSLVFGTNNLAALFSGTVANGDFTLGGTGAGASAAALLAGPQNHWDWNARAVAGGPPAAWPNVPDTLAEAATYCQDPEAWEFYP